MPKTPTAWANEDTKTPTAFVNADTKNPTSWGRELGSLVPYLYTDPTLLYTDPNRGYTYLTPDGNTSNGKNPTAWSPT